MPQFNLTIGSKDLCPFFQSSIVVKSSKKGLPHPFLSRPPPPPQAQVKVLEPRLSV
jgi:hypothetical protein